MIPWDKLCVGKVSCPKFGDKEIDLALAGHPVLYTPALEIKPQQPVNGKLSDLIEEMHETLHRAGGVGLAAPQIKFPGRIVVIEDRVAGYSDEALAKISVPRKALIDRERTAEIPFHVLVNPVVTPLGVSHARFYEACLALVGRRIKPSVRRDRLIHYLTKKSGYTYFYESCLSVPERSMIVKRARRIRVQTLNALGESIEFEASGWYARIIQHEVDHLNGWLIIDRMVPRTYAVIAFYNARLKDLTKEQIEAYVQSESYWHIPPEILET